MVKNSIPFNENYKERIKIKIKDERTRRYILVQKLSVGPPLCSIFLRLGRLHAIDNDYAILYFFSKKQGKTQALWFLSYLKFNFLETKWDRKVRWLSKQVSEIGSFS